MKGVNVIPLTEESTDAQEQSVFVRKLFNFQANLLHIIRDTLR